MRGTGLLLAGIVAIGCGGEERFEGSPDPATERSDRAAAPPTGWRTATNRRAGFTLSVPRDWSVRTRGGATLIRSSDRLLAVTVAADRSQAGRGIPPERYARRAFRALPGFRGRAAQRTRPVARSPYPSARVDGAGILARGRQRQRITVAAFRRRGRVTYTAVAFANAARTSGSHRRALSTLLASLRGRRPAL